MQSQSLFVFVSAAGPAPEAGDLLRGAVRAGWRTFVVATPNLAMVTAPEALFADTGAHWIRDYKQPPLDEFPFGTMLVAPCTFNTFNKLAHGIADTLATAMVADALGAGCPLLLAPSMNRGLWAHPQVAISLARLRSWGCVIIDPQITPETVRMASVETILAQLGAPPASG